jgi:hypothetical protein
MPFIVSAKPFPQTGGEGTFEALTRKDAVEKAVGLLDQGIPDVTITDEQGRVYAPHEFDQFFLAGEN